MGTAHHVSNALARPIAVTEFVNALSSIWRPLRVSHRHRKKETIGLAVSGGVDSMALAALCSQIQSGKITGVSETDIRLATLRRLEFKAFVVDHGVRTGSPDEAQAVAKALEARGIETNLLKINWGPFEKPAEQLNFESLARKYRFQVLGNACRARGINSLFLAHHEDDQVETVVMRLISGHQKLGLMGMKPESEIPECYGIHGVHESGGRPDFSLIPRILAHAASKKSKHRAKSYVKEGSTLPLETGGIRVYRPLLKFNKERLIATSKDQEIEWFEDHTNKDPTLTMRNAVRHMYRSHALPTALKKPALLKLLQRCQEISNAQLKIVDMFLSRCTINDFDTRSGTMKIRFNDMNDVPCPPETDRKLIAAHILRRVTMLVTPREHIPLSTLHHDTLKNIFPEVFSPEKTVSTPASFTVAGLHFQPRATQEKSPLSLSKCEWFISRQPHLKSIANPHITVPPSDDASWSEWSLYDGRYWIRIRNLSQGTILIRHLGPDDYDEFRHSFSQPTRSSLHELLKKIAPGNARFTLPCIVRKGEDGKETVIALPTLNFRWPECKEIVNWEARYKKLNLAGLSIANQPSLE